MGQVWGVAMLAVLALAGCQKKAETGAEVRTGSGGATAVRKAGLWEMTTRSEGVTQVTRLCAGPGAETSVSVAGPPGAKACSQIQVGGAAHGLEVRSDCTLAGGGRAVSEGRISGDLGSAYTLAMTSTVTGAPGPLMNGTRSTTIAAVWKGPCPAGMKVGEIELPDGTRIRP